MGGGYERSQSPFPVLSLSAPAQYSWTPDRHTWDVASEFLVHCKNKGLSPLTVNDYRSTLSKFSDMFPDLPMRLEAIDAFLGTIPHLQDEWKHRQFRNLRAFYYWIADFKDYPPARLRFRLVTPKRGRKVRDNLSNEQALKFLELIEQAPARDQAIIGLLLEAGPRVGELCTIRKEHILDTKIKIKGKTGEREISIGPEIRGKLLALTPEPTGSIFFDRLGKPMSRDAIYRMIQGYLVQIGITSGKRGPHMLRHSFGRLYLEHGGDLESLRQQLGHTNIGTTAIYAELGSEQVHKRAMAASPYQNIMRQMHLDEVLEGKAEENASD